MIRFLTAISFFASLVALGLELPKEDPKLSGYRTKILYARVAQVLQYRERGLKACVEETSSEPTHGSVGRSLSDSIQNALAKSSPDTNGVLQLMQLLQATNARRECEAYYIKYDGLLARAERKHFIWAEALALQAGVPAPLIALLDPHCAVGPQKNWDGTLDTNACFAGEQVVFAHLNLHEVEPFLYRFYIAVRDAHNGAPLNWWDFYDGDAPQNFLALMVFMTAATTSNYGSVDGFGDEAWQKPLREGLSPKKAFDEYRLQKRQKDTFRDVFEWGLRKKLKFTLFNIDLSHANRHDFMAAYLACALRLKILPRALGYAYESKDFVSHIQDHVTFKASIQNFREDTSRYDRASGWGYAFCGK